MHAHSHAMCMHIVMHAASRFYFTLYVMHQSFVTPAPPPHTHTYGDGRGIAGLICGAMTFCVPPQCRVSAGLVILRKYIPVEFTLRKSRAMTLSRSPHAGLLAGLLRTKSRFPRYSPQVGTGMGGGSGYK